MSKFKLREHSEPPMTINDFRTLANSLKGSQDVGAQLFCALLRSIGIESRLVCSFQCLPFTAVAPVGAAKPKGQMNTIHLDSDGNRLKNQEQSHGHPSPSRRDAKVASPY